MFRRKLFKRGQFEHFYQQSFKVYFYKIERKHYFFIFFIGATNIKMGNFETLTENGKYVVKREKYRTGYIQESMATPPLNLVSRDRVRIVVHPPIQCPENKKTSKSFIRTGTRFNE